MHGREKLPGLNSLGCNWHGRVPEGWLSSSKVSLLTIEDASRTVSVLDVFIYLL
ncbi:hypothetical protein Tco_1565045, partial [Tanacetum coccineum]